jgi:hypothetical protein
MKRKIVQIAFEVEGGIDTERVDGEIFGVNGSINSTLFALADDGSIWRLTWNREKNVQEWLPYADSILPDTDLEEQK